MKYQESRIQQIFQSECGAFRFRTFERLRKLLLLLSLQLKTWNRAFRAESLQDGEL